MSTSLMVEQGALDQMTDDQWTAIKSLLGGNTTHVHVGRATFGLPDEYLSFRREYENMVTPIYGGIDAEGRIST